MSPALQRNGPPTDPAFDLQIVRRGVLPEALKRRTTHVAEEELAELGAEEQVRRRLVEAADPDTILGQIPTRIRGRSGTVAKRLGKRRNDFARAQAKFETLAEDLNSRWEELIPKMEKRLKKAGVNPGLLRRPVPVSRSLQVNATSVDGVSPLKRTRYEEFLFDSVPRS